MKNIQLLEKMIKEDTYNSNELLEQLSEISKEYCTLITDIEEFKQIKRRQEITIKEKDCSISMLRSMISGIIDNY